MGWADHLSGNNDLKNWELYFSSWFVLSLFSLGLIIGSSQVYDCVVTKMIVNDIQQSNKEDVTMLITLFCAVVFILSVQNLNICAWWLIYKNMQSRDDKTIESVKYVNQ